MRSRQLSGRPLGCKSSLQRFHLRGKPRTMYQKRRTHKQEKDRWSCLNNSPLPGLPYENRNWLTRQRYLPHTRKTSKSHVFLSGGRIPILPQHTRILNTVYRRGKPTLNTAIANLNCLLIFWASRHIHGKISECKEHVLDAFKRPFY